jgi:hypothetical protein
MDDNDLDSFNVSFIDIVKNFLGLLILILVLLQGSVMLTDASRAPLRLGKDEPLRPFSAALRDYLHPLTDHYYVAANRILRIDWGKLAAQIEGESGLLATARGKFQSPVLGDGEPPVTVQAQFDIPGPNARVTRESDLNAFSLSIAFPALEQVALPSKAEIDTLVGEILKRTKNGARAPVFIVADTGFPLFVAVHEALTQRHICFRWVEYASDDPHIDFERVRETYAHYASRKCRVRRT